MTNIYEAAQQALDYIEGATAGALAKAYAFEALRSALAQQGEPVASRFEAMHANGDVWITTLAAAAIARSTAAPAAQPDADPNATWMTEAHMLCTDHGIPQGNLTERIRALRDKLAQQGEPVAWQPIETAPKDGTVVDLWVRPYTGQARRFCSYWWLESDSVWRTGEREHDVPRNWTATHWMPLPPAPAAQQGEPQPVAWMHRETRLLRLDGRKGSDFDVDQWVPLYAEAAPAAQSK